MFKRWLLPLFCIALCACTHHRSSQALPELEVARVRIHKTTCVDTFNKIDIRGKINVQLHTGYKKPLVQLAGDPRDLIKVTILVKGTTLFLIIPKGYPKFGPLDADIRSPFLYKLHYVGAGLIRGDRINSESLELIISNDGNNQFGGKIRLNKLVLAGKGLTQISGILSPELTIELKGSPKVRLEGVAHLRRLVMDGNAWLSLYWIKSDYLKIIARKNTTIQLAGSVGTLDVGLWGKAKFKGRYIRAHNVFVKTHDHAMAEISAVKNQHTLATGASDIYYFNLSKTRTDFLAFNGSTLNMREWSVFDREKMTRYNKQFP